MVPVHLLDEIRKLVRASDVVRRKFKLKKEGSKDWRVVGNNSLTVADDKGLWHDFSTGENGDVFQFLVKFDGMEFLDAVSLLARECGVDLGEHGPKRGNSAPARSSSEPPPDDPSDPGYGMMPIAQSRDGGAKQASQRKITNVYPYVDRDGMTEYEVCRFEWVEDGKRKKNFAQRRPASGKPGSFIWGLDAGPYIRGRWSDDYYKATDERRKQWAGRIADEIEVADGVAHTLYCLPEIVDELGESIADQRVIWWPEGEKDADTLRAWGLVATTVSGGAKNVLPHHAEWLRGADVVIPMDNDAAGRGGAHKKAAMLRGIARRVRVLDFRDHWPGCPDKGDVTDWKNFGAGNVDKLFAIVEKLKDWTPSPPETKFNAIRFADLDLPSRELEWLVKGVLTRGEVSIWWGPPGCGKSFLIVDCGLAIATGQRWFGQRSRKGLVVYQAGEGGLGLKRRLRAWRKQNSFYANIDVPFVLMNQRINLFSDDADMKALIDEIKLWSQYHDAPLEMVVIDTFSAASTGANENASEDVGRVLQRCHHIARETMAHVALVHHTPKAGGSPRGWGGLTGNVENSIEVIRTELKETIQLNDGSTILRDRREFHIRKQKDGEDGQGYGFTLKQVKMGVDEEGDDITSCVVDPSRAQPTRQTGGKVKPPNYYEIVSANSFDVMRALKVALAENGIPMSVEARRDAGWDAGRMVKLTDWSDALYKIKGPPGGDDPNGTKLRESTRKLVRRTFSNNKNPWDEKNGLNLIGRFEDYVFRTPRKIFMIDEPPQPVAQPVKRPTDTYLPDDADDFINQDNGKW